MFTKMMGASLWLVRYFARFRRQVAQASLVAMKPVEERILVLKAD